MYRKYGKFKHPFEKAVSDVLWIIFSTEEIQCNDAIKKIKIFMKTCIFNTFSIISQVCEQYHDIYRQYI